MTTPFTDCFFDLDGTLTDSAPGILNGVQLALAHFGLRACRDSSPDAETRKRCLKRIVRDCSAPCTGAVSEAEYRQLVERVLQVLSGDIGELSTEIREKMQQDTLWER